MWISRETFSTLLAEAIASKTEARTLSEELHIFRTNMDWMRHRINALEHERAMLLFKNYDLKVAVPQVEYNPVPVSKVDYTATPSFDDVGDEEAEKLGITYAPDGTLLYSERNRYSSK